MKWISWLDSSETVPLSQEEVDIEEAITDGAKAEAKPVSIR